MTVVLEEEAMAEAEAEAVLQGEVCLMMSIQQVKVKVVMKIVTMIASTKVWIAVYCF